jgi:hypothetical protein
MLPHDYCKKALLCAGVHGADGLASLVVSLVFDLQETVLLARLYSEIEPSMSDLTPNFFYPV